MNKDHLNDLRWVRSTKNDKLDDLRNFALAQAYQHNQLRGDLDRLLAYLDLELFDGREIREREEAK